MNSEELEKSLRTEFESYLKDALADMRQEVFQLQYKIDSELEKYKSQIDEVFKEFSDRAREDKPLGENFSETIVEHLRLARDDGATITAKAIAEAEKMEKEMTPSSFDVSDLRDAINDISNQTSQATILSSLINHAEKFVPRGAFFVVKNQNFVGWRVFGNENPSGDDAIREIFFETSMPTVLSKAVNSLQTVESTYGSFEDDSVFLDPLDFGEPDRMFAVPLLARGRGVAAIYADPGVDGNDVNVAALETLVRIAGLTVELLAASHSAVSKSTTAPAESSYTQPSQAFVKKPSESAEETLEEEEETKPVQAEEAESYSSSKEPAETFKDVEEETGETEDEETHEIAEAKETYQVSEENEEADSEIEESYEESYETAPAVDYEEYSEIEADDSYETVAFDNEETVNTEETYEVSSESETSSAYDISPIQKPAEPFIESSHESLDTNEYLGEEKAFEDETPTDDFASDDDLVEEVQASGETVEKTEEFEYQDAAEEESDEEEVSDSFEVSEPIEEIEVGASETDVESEESSFEDSPVETVSEPAVAAPPVRSRLAGRNVDLPIEVSEEERKLHNDARRFARLLVSEIKLYNEQKVLEGRSSGDLYERLREAIDRSREMYDKRVQPPVAERFDYFHYEVVNTLGEGEESSLGNSYPGSTV